MNTIRKKFTKFIISAVLAGAALVTSASAATITANKDVNVRSNASTSSKQIAVLSEGASRTVLGTSGKWFKVKVSGKYGYVHGNNVTKSITKTTVKTTGNCALRELPSSESKLISSVSKGTTVTATGISGNWYKVSVNDKTGYIHNNYLDMFYSAVCSKAETLIGSRYVYGATGPNAFDCSGFAQYVYKQNGKSIPRTSSSQYAACKKVSKSNLKAGQLVFFSSGGSGVGHVGIYIGNGNMIHAANSSRGVVRDSINSSYYASHYIGAGYFN